jgi:16S rRNA (guanine527-N7)-methyltransferase
MKKTNKEPFSLDGMRLDARAVEQLEEYLALILKWNGRINLTATRKPEEILRRHFAESVFAARQVPEEVKTLLDFGSGAGFPGIPIAICRPKIAVTLAESQQKKAAFLREAARTLGLKADVWAGRVEEMADPVTPRQRALGVPASRVFDAVTLRAVDRMTEACETAVERLVPEGWLAVFATRKTEPALDKLNGIRWETAVPIPGTEQEILKMGLRA